MMEIPVTMSAFSRGILFRPIKKDRFFSDMALRPMQARTPIIVAMVADHRAMERVFPRASMISEF